MKYALQAVNNGIETSLAEGLLLESSLFAICASTEDKKEGTSAFLEKRAAQIPGASKEILMTNENIFSGLKVVDLSSFIAGPSAAVILSDYGADVVKVEPPAGDAWRHIYKVPPQPRSQDNYLWHLNNRNKRGMALDLKSPHAGEILERLVKWADVFIVNTPHPARKKLKLEYEDVAQWNPRLIYADLTGYGEKGPDASLPGFDITAYWARSGLLSLTRDAGAPPTLPPSGQWRSRDCGNSVFRDRHRSVSARADGKGFLRHHLASRRGSLVLRRLRSGRALRRHVLPFA